jgi:ubiquinone/menaquinone biosynthesis C-methylase UbiE
MSGGPDEQDPDEIRAALRDRWDRSAEGWRAGNRRFQAATMSVSRALVEAIDPQPGQRVLELAAGIGETGFLAAELIEPGGTLISTDGAEAMQAQAKERAAELGLRNVEFKLADLEWIDVGTAEVDAVLCRWGYMFALDRGASLRETRRVLRPGGHVALATWAAPDRNPWATISRVALYDAGLIDTLHQTGPDMFDLADEAGLRELLEDAGFFDPETHELELTFSFEDAGAYWDATREMSQGFADVVATLDARQEVDLRERVAAGLAPYAIDGALRLPAVALLAAATA